MDEKQAIQRLKQGDISGLEFLVSCHQVKAVRTAYLITRDLGLAEDIVQESFIQAFHAMRGFDATRPFEPWFMRSAFFTDRWCNKIALDAARTIVTWEASLFMKTEKIE